MGDSRMSDVEKKADGKRGLTDGDVSTTPALGRRSVLAMVGVAAGAATLASGEAPVRAQAGVSDRDGPPNPNADPPGLGRGYGRGTNSGVTDQDQGTVSDPPNNGRGPAGQRMAGVTDRDQGSNADPPNNGRGPGRERPSGQTDQDQEPMADPQNNGRGPRRQAQQRGK
jgi:hypothetical protein